MNASAANSFAQGVAALDAGDYTTAERILQAIVEQNPAAHSAWLALAVVAMRAGAPDIAVARAQRAVELDRSNALYINNLGIAYAEQGDLRAAEQTFRRALKIDPAYAAAHYNLAKALHKDARLAESLVEYERAYALDPRSTAIQVGLCGMHRLRGQPERALAVLRAIAGDAALQPALVPHFAECIADVEGPEAAVAWLREQLARQPHSQPTHHILSVLLLSFGHWREGWQHYLWRTHAAPERTKAVLPARLDGKRILLRGEQGLGDILFFLRFAAELRDRGATVALECPPKLVPLVADQIAIDEGAASDLQVSIADLPALLETDAVPPALALRADDSQCMRAREKLARLGRPPYLGLTWQAGTNVLRKREYGTDLALLFKEIPPALLGQAVRGWPGTLVSLQRGPTSGDLQAIRAATGAEVHDLSPANEDLAEVLAVLAQLDEYVAVSSTNMHLLAGLGRSARVLVPHPPEWRWMRRDGPSPWFPAFPVYRQPPGLDWTEPLKRLRQDLFISAGSPRPAPA
jgi:Tfp pilus assembly protein PilF